MKNTSKSKIIDITPDTSLLPKLGHAGYTAPQAIAELVDNSIDAKIEDATVNISLKIKPDEISIADTGAGMNEEEMSKCLIPAYSQKKGKLGEFGLGMKTACLSLGSEFTVISKAENDEFEHKIFFNEHEWANSNDGWKIMVDSKYKGTKEHYTIVIIKGLKVFYPALPNYIKEDLQKRFSPYIRAGFAEISVNKNLCRPDEFKLVEDTRKDFDIITPAGKKIRGWYGLLLEGSNKGLYGFHTYRRNRMITTYDKIAIGEHPTISRIIGEIHMDHVPVTHNKREFLKESHEYREAVELLKQEFKDLIRLARKKAGEETITKDVKNNLEVWKDKISEAVNSKDFRNYTSRFKNLSQVIADAQGVETSKAIIEKRDKDKDPKKQEEKDPKTQRDRKPKKTHEVDRHIIRIKGKNIEFSHQFSALGVRESWKRFSYESGKKIEIFTNTDFPAYMVTKDKVFYAVIHIAEAISEVMIQESNEDFANINEIKELILRKASELKEQFHEEI